jgi:carbonic anhydrase
MSHHCHAIVVCCIDFRFQKYIRKWTDENLKDKTFDLVGFAGSTKDLGTILGQIDISVRLHHISQVVLIHHEECGAYGAESTREKHTADLIKAKSAILSRYPHLDIRLYYLLLSGEFIPVQ